MVITHDDKVLVTGAAGFIGARVVAALLEQGFRNLRCLVRPTGNAGKLERLVEEKGHGASAEIFRGNLLSKRDCAAAVEGVSVIYHLAAGRGEKLVADAFMNSVVTTRNLLDAAVASSSLKRIVSVSSFSVYSNQEKPGGSTLDERAPVENDPVLRGDAYSFAKVKQDELIIDYGRKHKLSYVLVRPGFVYGPGNESIPGRVGINTFGVFLHLGGSNPIPFTYVDNCAQAIVLAGVVPGIDGEVVNVVDDETPTSREFLRLYKRNVRKFRSIYVPKPLSYLGCYLWERYSERSEGQLPPLYNRRVWHAYWKKTRYTNKKLKELGWQQRGRHSGWPAGIFYKLSPKANHDKNEMIAVTGAVGFIGSRVMHSLLKRITAEDLVAIDHPLSKDKCENRELFAPVKFLDHFTFLRELNTLSPEVIIHLGACSSTVEGSWPYLQQNNVEYSKALWQWCAETGNRFIYASSAATYGDGSQGFNDESDIRLLQPLNLYGRSKQEFDIWVEDQSAAKQKPVQCVGLKFFNVYGPGEGHKGRMASMTFHAFNQIRQAGAVRLFQSHRPDFEHGGQLRDFIYVEQVVETIEQFINRKDVSGLFNVGSGRARTFRDLVEAVFCALKQRPSIEYIPMPEDLRGKYQYFTEAKMRKSAAHGIEPKEISLEDGVRDYVAYLLK